MTKWRNWSQTGKHALGDTKICQGSVVSVIIKAQCDLLSYYRFVNVYIWKGGNTITITINRNYYIKKQMWLQITHLHSLCKVIDLAWSLFSLLLNLHTDFGILTHLNAFSALFRYHHLSTCFITSLDMNHAWGLQ